MRNSKVKPSQIFYTNLCNVSIPSNTPNEEEEINVDAIQVNEDKTNELLKIGTNGRKKLFIFFPAQTKVEFNIPSLC